jgi:hypothetical protein
MKPLYFLFVFVFGMLACDDEIDNHHPIIATWKEIAQGYYDSVGNLVVDSGVSSMHIEFRADGKRAIYDLSSNENRNIVDYKIVNDKIYLNYKDKKNTFIYKFELSNSNNQLLTRYISEDSTFVYPEYYIAIYQRVE